MRSDGARPTLSRNDSVERTRQCLPKVVVAFAETTPRRLQRTLRQPLHHLVELIEVAIADLHAAAGVAVVDDDLEPERVADAALEVERVGVLLLGPRARLLRLALRHALFMRKRLGL